MWRDAGQAGGISSVSLKADSSLCGGSLLVRCFHTLHFLHSRHILLFPLSDMRLSKSLLPQKEDSRPRGRQENMLTSCGIPNLQQRRLRLCGGDQGFPIALDLRLHAGLIFSNRGDFASVEANRAFRSPWTFGPYRFDLHSS